MKIKGITQRLFLVALSVCIAVAICEFFLRIFDYNYAPIEIKILNDTDWRYHHAMEDQSFIYDPSLIWRPKNDYAIFNSQGKIKDFTPKKDPQEIRIFAIGDSNTWGSFGEAGPNWPIFLQEFFAETDGRITVVNAGASGYSLFQGLRRFKEILDFSPDTVLICFGANDAHEVTISDEEFTRGNFLRQYEIDKLLMKLKVGQLLIAFWDKVLIKKNEFFLPRVSLEEYKDYLNQIIDLSRERGIDVVLLTRPLLVNDYTIKMIPYNTAATEVSETEGILLVDLYGYFQEQEVYFDDFCHFNREGHKLAAEYIYDNIREFYDYRRLHLKR